jgi:G:T-mismatch repair DNA endonuclease (very short patch repair protein)
VSAKGKKQTPEWVVKRVKSRSGYHPTPETRIKQSMAKMGQNNPMYGKHLTEEAKQKFRISRAGYRHSPETRQKLRRAKLMFYKEHPEAIDSFKGKNNPMFGKKGILSPMFGKHLSEEARLKLSHSKKGMYQGTKNPFFGKHHSENTKRKLSEKWRTREFRQKNNRLEIKLQNELLKNNITFKTHATLNGRPDLFIEPNICIFVDGCYWRGCSCKFNPKQSGQHAAYIKTRITHDLKINEELASQNLIVIRLKEHEINNNVSACAQKICSFVPK